MSGKSFLGALQCVAVWCIVLQSGILCCSMSQCDAMRVVERVAVRVAVLGRAAFLFGKVIPGVLQHIAVCCVRCSGK